MAAVGQQMYINPNFFQNPPPDFAQPPPQLNSYSSYSNEHQTHSGNRDNHSYSHNSHNNQPGRDNSVRDHGSAKSGMSGAHMPPGMDARRMRKAVFRRTIDYNTPIMRHLNQRLWQVDFRDRWAIQPDYLYQAQLEPPMSYLDNPMNCVTTKHVRTSTNKNKCPVYCVCWTPEGRRLITGAYSGEFTLWNGLTFNFETILQAHETQIRCMKWSHNEDWLLTADHSGYVKYWQANMNNVEMFQAHKEPIRGVSFCPSDDKFVTCCDDSTVRIWDFYQCSEERVLRGHGADVRCVAWHPYKSLIISGSKDAQQPIKLWAPRTGESIATLYVHKNTCTDVAWNKNGNWFLTASRDHLIKLFDIRNLKTEMQTFRGHKKDVMRVAWHPFHESLFVSGSADGAIMYWMVGTDMEVGSVEDAHENMIWSLAWHPLGHILVSGANDFATKFWTRNRPGDQLKEATGGGHKTNAQSTSHEEESQHNQQSTGITGTALPLHLDDDLEDDNFQNQTLDDDMASDLATTNPNMPATIPGLNDGAVIDLNLEEEDSEEKEKAKARAIKSIPRQFATNWASARLAAMPALLPNNVRPMQPMTGSAPVQPSPNIQSGSPQGHPMMRMPMHHQQQHEQALIKVNKPQHVPNRYVDSKSNFSYFNPDGFMSGPHVRSPNMAPQMTHQQRPDLGSQQGGGHPQQFHHQGGPQRFPPNGGRMPPPTHQQDQHPQELYEDYDEEDDSEHFEQVRPPHSQHNMQQRFSRPPHFNPRGGPPFRPPPNQRPGFPPGNQRGPPPQHIRGNFPPRGGPHFPHQRGPFPRGPPRFSGPPGGGFPPNGPPSKRPRGPPIPWRGGP